MNVFGRLYAAGFDWVQQRMEADGVGEHRRRTVAGLTGDVLEVGAGTGRNFRFYDSARRVVALEPDPSMRERAVRRAQRTPVPVEVVEGDAQRLPFPDDSFDAAVVSLVLCSIPEPERALAELHRVLRPGGVLRFYEHVRADDPGLAARQDRWNTPWRWATRGCNVNRPSLRLVDEAGFRVDTAEAFEQPGVPRVVRPHVLGTAVAEKG